MWHVGGGGESSTVRVRVCSRVGVWIRVSIKARLGSRSMSDFFDFLIFLYFMHFCPGTMTTHAESINSDLQRGLD